MLAGSERVRQGLTRKVTQFAIGRPRTAADGPVLDAIHRESEEGCGTYASLIAAVVMSELVYGVRTDTDIETSRSEANR